MTQTSTIRQILSAPELGLLPYLRHQLQNSEFSQFETQFSFQARESLTQVKQGDSKPELQTTLSISLQFLITLHNQVNLEEVTLLALELQEMLEASLVGWSQRHPQLLLPLAEIQSSFGNLEEVRYQGAYLPGFSLNLKFELAYSADAIRAKDSTIARATSSEQNRNLYKPGERTPQSGQYELFNHDAEGTGVEVTSTQGNPLPPTPEPNQLYKLVDPTKHKKA